MDNKSDEMPILDHFDELRRILIIGFTSTILLAIVAYFFSDQILAFMLNPLTMAGHVINYTGITEPIIVKIKISLFVGFLASMPVILWKSRLLPSYFASRCIHTPMLCWLLSPNYLVIRKCKGSPVKWSIILIHPAVAD